MSSSSPWLATLLRVREHRRDTALQSLAQSLQAASKIHESAAAVEVVLTRLNQTQRQCSQFGGLDSERLRQIRQDRDDLRRRLNEFQTQQKAADAAVQLAQANATAKDAEAEVLRRLQDRLDSTQRLVQRRRDEQSPLEVTVSLCNGRLSD